MQTKLQAYLWLQRMLQPGPASPAMQAAEALVSSVSKHQILSVVAGIIILVFAGYWLSQSLRHTTV